ncbi:3-isopropylmalate dehydratase [Niabella sp. W65]|nr:3-isopropylmalate dehydratase [Niabella sp. W65]MCH7364067.1 3-isopropylmalate dehydratase [Niabella sp. W65]ULT39947.1 3-isopropylmalate dehydratase [Niabella sp. I65]
MKIVDLNGCEIEITNLDKAIEETEYFKDAYHIPPVESDKQRQVYWRDIYEKLLTLNSTQNEQPRR